MKKTTIVTRKPCTFSIGGIDMKKATLVALATVVMTLVMCFTLFTNVARAEEEYPTYTYTDSNGTLTLTVDEYDYLIISGNYETVLGTNGEVAIGQGVSIYGFDQYGTAWRVKPGLDTVSGWNYYLQYDEEEVFYNYILDENGEYVMDAESLVFDENNQYVIGYKTFTGETKPLLSYEEIVKRSATRPKNDPDPTPTPTAKPTPTPNQPGTPSTPAVVNPTTNPGTVQPSDNKQPDVQSAKITLKKKGNTTSLYKGNTVVSKFTLKKGVLKYNGRTYKKVKSAGFIKKSGNLIFMDNKGKVFTVNAKGKKKTILKKNAKKLVFKSGYVTKVQKKSGSLNVAGK